MITVEQIVNTQKTNIDTFFGLSGKAFEGVEKLIELNLSAAKSAMAEAAQTHQARRCPPRTRKSWSPCRRA